MNKKLVLRLLLLSVVLLIVVAPLCIAQSPIRPDLGALPSYTPDVSGNTVAQSLPENQPLSRAQVSMAGRMPVGQIPRATYATNPISLQELIFSNGAWSFGPASIYSNGQMSIVAYNNQPQNIYGYEKYYSSGREVFRYWGYRYSNSYVHSIFVGDEPGWHALALYGDVSGWSNLVWIYVYPQSGPNPTYWNYPGHWNYPDYWNYPGPEPNRTPGPEPNRTPGPDPNHS